MDYEEWERTVPEEIKCDSVWKIKAYRLALFAADLSWEDVTRLAQDRRTVALSDQLYRSIGSISANIAEGYSRGTGKDRARFYEYALGSTRESRDWYYKGRHVLLILGLGNPLRGDDGIGPRVIEELNRRGLPEGVTALDGGIGGLDLLNVLEGWERVIIVDAADIGQEPGQFARFTPDQMRLAGSTDALSLHHAGLAEALALAQALGQPLPEITILGVQPATTEWGEGLSPVMEAVLPTVVEAVLEVGMRKT